MSVEVTDGKELEVLDRIDLVQIDVEGFELAVLQAIAPILEKFRPPVITELMEEHLGRAGSSSASIIELVAKFGYRGFVLHIRNVDLMRQSAGLSPLDPGGRAADCNVLWIPEDTVAPVLTLDFRSLRNSRLVENRVSLPNADFRLPSAHFATAGLGSSMRYCRFREIAK